MGKQWKQWETLFWEGSKITADVDCNHEIRHLLLGRKAMRNLDSILKSRDITLPAKVYIVKAMAFPIVMYGCDKVKVAQSCPTLCDHMDYTYSSWNSPGQNTGVGSFSLLQGIFPTQGSNPGLRIAGGVFTNWATRGAHGCESWTIKKTEHQRIDAFKLWCWRRFLRIP